MNVLKLVVFSSALCLSPALLAADAPTAKPAAEAHPYTAKTPKLDRKQVDEWLSKPDEVLFVDVRRPDELTKIGGFPVYFSVQINELESRLAFIPDDRKIITVSNHAGRAGKSADLLADKGFDVVGAVGVEDYQAEGGALSKIQPPAPKAGAELKK